MRPWDQFIMYYGFFAQREGSAIRASVMNDPEMVDELASQPEPSGPTPPPPLFGHDLYLSKLTDIEDQLQIMNFRDKARFAKRPVYPFIAERKRRGRKRQADAIELAQQRAREQDEARRKANES
ncbi:hypothetical protein [Mycobacteroides abscessus]|uniref:hypothetical protein n=1 Tax=Mycobacteroides abscessus TaxID=36809 RepID=UPI000E692D4C|nr:hypothetical protein [Mycobacteroides abscessus]RIU40335.1 hypothetical protein D2E83_11225 [Mycobacteroides abscessus]